MVPVRSLVVACQKFFWENKIHMFTHPRLRTHNRPKCGYHQSTTWWTSKSYWGCLQEYGWGVAFRDRKNSKTATSPKLTQGWRIAHQVGSLKHTAQTVGSSTDRRASFLSDSIDLNLLQASGRVSACSKQLVSSQTLLCSWTSLPLGGRSVSGTSWSPY